MANLLQELQAIRANAITSLEDKQQELLIKALQQLENKVVETALKLPNRNGVLFDTRLAIELRPQLQKDRKSTRLNSSHSRASRMPSSA